MRRALGTTEMAVAVHAEIQRGIRDGYEFLRAVDAQMFPAQADGWIHLTDLENDEERERYVRLIAVIEPGEAMTLSIAACRGWTFATDDRAARQIAVREGVAITGTLGILLELIDQGTLSLDEANGVLVLMISRARYRSPVTDLSVLLNHA